MKTIRFLVLYGALAVGAAGLQSCVSTDQLADAQTALNDAQAAIEQLQAALDALKAAQEKQAADAE